MDMGSHLINLMRWYFGEITEIKSHLGYRFNMDFEDSAMCLAKFESGTVALVNVGWFSQQYTLKVDFFGSVKNLTAIHSPPNPLVGAIQMLATGKSKFYQAHIDELRNFIDYLISGIPPKSSEQDGLRDMEAIDLAYKNQIY